MSMLAEPKRKQKWSLNPRGKAWSQDANKFGQKMLEKMGWQQGKGLGANEHGITEHIKISYKNDSKGMGYKETDNQWTEHESNFTALLKSLTGDDLKQPEEVKLNSIEEQSQSSKARVHYHKFTRGKDLTRYSEKDLANIFGKKSLKATKVKVEKQEDACQETSSSDNNSSSLLINSGSMQDYFKKKLPKLGKSKGYVVGNNGVLKKDSESEDEFKTFGFGFNQTEIKKEAEETSKSETFISYIDNFKKRKLIENHIDNIFSPKKKLKNKDKDVKELGGLTNPAYEPLASHLTFTKNILTSIPESTIEEHEEDIIDNETTHNISSENSTVIKKKKKKSKCNNVENINVIHEIDEILEEQEHSDILDNNSTAKTKDNKKKSEKNKDNVNIKCSKNYSSQQSACEFDNPNFSIDVSVSQLDIKNESNPYEVKPKLKKKNKDTFGIDNLNFNDIKSEDTTNDVEGNSFEIKRKKKKLKKLPEIHQISEDKYEHKENEETFTSTLDNIYEVIKSKVKKSKKEIKAIDNPSFNPNDSSELEVLEEKYSTLNHTYEVIKPKKKKKNKEIEELDNPGFNWNEFSESRDFNKNDVPLEITSEVIKSKKKKKVKKYVKAIDNPGFNPNDSIDNESLNEAANSIIIEDDLMLNIVSTPIIIKKPDQQNPCVESTTKTNLKRRKSVRFSDVTQELIIPNNDDLRELEESQDSDSDGVDNVNFDKIKNNIEENVETISNTIDRYQAEIENEINEKKQVTLEDIMIGEVGNPDGENEQLSDGTKLKFKYAHFDARTPLYQQNKVGPKKAYKHLIKGDIVIKFNNSNLHEIQGYALNKKPKIS